MNQDVLTFKDIFKKSFINLIPGTMSIYDILLVMLLAFIVGLGIFMVYRKYFTGVVYDHSFNVSLVIMTVLTAVIIITISTNVTLSLGMVGALSIVRYRTAVKNPLDLMFLFWSISSGIAIGARAYLVAGITFIFVTAIFIVLSRFKAGAGTYVLVINYDTSMQLEEDVRRTLSPYKGKLRSKIVKNDITELTMEILLKVENVNLTNRLKEFSGVHDVTLVQYRGSYDL